MASRRYVLANVHLQLRSLLGSALGRFGGKIAGQTIYQPLLLGHFHFDQRPSLVGRLWRSMVSGGLTLFLLTFADLGRHLFQYIIPRSGKRMHCTSVWYLTASKSQADSILVATLLSCVLGATHTAISRSDAGSLTNRFSQDILLIDTQLPISLFNTGIFLATTVVAYGLIASSSVLVLIAGPFIVLAVYCIQNFYLRTSKKLRLFDLEAKAPLYAHFTDALSGLSTIRAFGWESRLRAEHNRLLDLSQRPYYLMYCIQRKQQMILGLDAWTSIG